MQRLGALVVGNEVVCEARGCNAYARIVALCRADGSDVPEQMIQEGLAWTCVDYSDDYIGLEAQVRAKGRGIWDLLFVVAAQAKKAREHS